MSPAIAPEAPTITWPEAMPKRAWPRAAATPALAALVEQRAKLSARAQELEREATELDAQADALEE